MADNKTLSMLSWEVRVPVLSNPIFWVDITKALALTYLIMVLLMGMIMLPQGDVDAFLALLLIFLAVVVGIFILALPIVLLIFGNGFSARFTFTDEEAVFEQIDRKSKFLNRLAIGVGAVSGNLGATGAGLIATSQEQQAIPWSGISQVVARASRKMIVLRNRWRNLMVVYCTKENYDQACAFAKAHASPEPLGEQKKVNPLFKVLGYTAVVIISCLPMFVMPYPFELDLFVPIFILCFGATTVWLARFLGFAVIAGVLYAASYVIYTGFLPNKGYIFAKGTYTQFEMLSGDEWFGLIIFFIGCVALVYISVLAIRGKLKSILEGDYAGDN